MPDDSRPSMWSSFHAALIGGQRLDEFDAIYGRLVRNWAARHGLQPADAADLCHDLYVQLPKKMSKYDPAQMGTFHGWLRTVVFNMTRDHFRRLKREEEAGKEVAVDELAAGVSELAESRRAALDAVRAECSARDWEIALACKVGGLKAVEAAREFGTSAGAVYQAVHRVGDVIKKHLGAP